MDEMTIAFKHDTLNRIVTIGGNVRYSVVMERIVSDAFDYHPKVKPVYTQINKMRFTFKKKIKQVQEAIEWLKINGYVVEETTNLQNIMR